MGDGFEPGSPDRPHRPSAGAQRTPEPVEPTPRHAPRTLHRSAPEAASIASAERCHQSHRSVLDSSNHLQLQSQRERIRCRLAPAAGSGVSPSNSKTSLQPLTPKIFGAAHFHAWPRRRHGRLGLGSPCRPIAKLNPSIVAIRESIPARTVPALTGVHRGTNPGSFPVPVTFRDCGTLRAPWRYPEP